MDGGAEEQPAHNPKGFAGAYSKNAKGIASLEEYEAKDVLMAAAMA
jgi:hypothetical protein